MYKSSLFLAESETSFNILTVVIGTVAVFLVLIVIVVVVIVTLVVLLYQRQKRKKRLTDWQLDIMAM